MKASSWISCFFFVFFLILSCYTPTARPLLFPTANLSSTKVVNESFLKYAYFTDGSKVKPILLRQTNGTQFGCGFWCKGSCTTFLFSIFIIQTNIDVDFLQPPQLVWSANPDYPVRHSAVLNITATGELVLRDADGSTVWTTNTAGKSVVGVDLTHAGNLVLFDVNNLVVWQSFDHPTDTLLPGQKLFEGQKLITTVPLSNGTGQKGMYSLQVTNKGFFAYVESNPPQAYYSKLVPVTNKNNSRSYVRFLNGSLSLFIYSAEPSDPDDYIHIPIASSTQYMKLTPDGHLKVFEWQLEEWTVVSDLTSYLEECNYPLVCGRNAVCSSNQQCSCPVSSSQRFTKDYFRAVNSQQANLGCSEIIPLTCNSTRVQDFVALKNMTYFTFDIDMMENKTDMEDKTDMETCKQACLESCSCKAALFQYGTNSSSGECYLPSELFTMSTVDPNAEKNAIAFIKVQNVRSPPFTSKKRVATVLGSTIACVVFLLILAIGSVMFIVSKKASNFDMEEEYIDQALGIPIRFSYEELKTATVNFSKRLGQGGFGSVFEGTLTDGSKIAVKCLEGYAKVKSFLAEVETIGNIHHVNLVRLRGFCEWKSQRLLVYEFMNNGSLDRWIYHGVRENALKWECRKKIIHDIAKGLAYLHEDCWQKIIHLDIKPQNILLDNKLNAKVSDFGLSKLINKNETQVITAMRGTPGCLAPEWLSSVITEKVDVYSFGIVVLEILCGRKNLDRSQPEESWHLLSFFQKCWEQENLLDMIDKYSEDMQVHGSEVLEMMKVAAWCLQTDFARRPSMSMVVMVLEGGINLKLNLDYNFTDPRPRITIVEDEKDVTPLLHSVLSEPR